MSESDLEAAAEIICNSTIHEDKRNQLAAEYVRKWTAAELCLDPEEDADLIHDIGELVALAMQRQHEQTTKSIALARVFETVTD